MNLIAQLEAELAAFGHAPHALSCASGTDALVLPLMAWGIGVPANPLSGLHLMMQGRYGIDGYAFLRWNASYVLKCLGAGVGLLYLYGMLLGVPGGICRGG